ncbi:MAG: class I SAM-dependent methyltransferase [Ruminococcaceae bacterium]|nr:class I SAM-dependent methyltransferase [Oscillospiraceae bacterium]
MSGYGEFAEVYDLLTFNVPYDELADYYAEILKRFGTERVLDMGCGTGSLTVRLAERGFDMIGQDASAEMLTIAAEKSSEVMWICQNMEETELGGTVDAVISTLDSANHLESAEDMLECFRRAADCLESGGAFVFDVNTVFKHREILGDNTFVYDVDGVYCVWQNTFDDSDNGVDIELDLFFENEDGSYSRGGESFREIALSAEGYCQLLEKAGFDVVNVWNYQTFDEPSENSEKLLVLAKKR